MSATPPGRRPGPVPAARRLLWVSLADQRAGREQRWLSLLRTHNAIFRRTLGTHDGYEVKNQGDGFMLVFPSPTAALRCAIEVQRALAEHAERSPDELCDSARCSW